MRSHCKKSPNDLTTQLAYADTLFRLRRHQQALNTLDTAQKLAPTEAKVYALRAQVHAKMLARDDAMQDIQLAEQYGKDDIDILMTTGGVLLSLGDRDAAMQRFSRALEIPKGDRLEVRLEIAQVFMREGHYDDVHRQLALGFAEARMSDSQVTGEDILEAANILLAVHDFAMAEIYFDKAKLAGANPHMVEIGLANTYIAEGENRKAEEALTSLGPISDFTDDYDYMLAAANLYRQRQDTVHALSSFAQANTVAGQENLAMSQTAQDELAFQEGKQITQNVSILPDASFAPALEDINVYTLDARILHVTNPLLLPPPRHSYEDLADSHYRIHLGNLPVISGFVGESFTTGRFLFPSVNVVQDRNTYDTYFNGGITPILRFGSNSIAFNGGLQYDIRRDTISPVFMSQNLFRQFLVYLHQFVQELGFLQRECSTGGGSLYGSEFELARSLRQRGIHGGKALGTHFAADRLHRARFVVQPAGARVLQHFQLCRNAAQVRQPVQRRNSGRRSTFLESARHGVCHCASVSAGRTVRVSGEPAMECTRVILTCHAERATMNTTMRRASFWFPIRVQQAAD